jgi:hypothetical protein
MASLPCQGPITKLSIRGVKLRVSGLHVIQSLSMRAIRFLPLVFVVGIDGFVMFAPYVLLLFVISHSVRFLKPQPQPARVSA